jgi:phi13 family phage major tail protein
LAQIGLRYPVYAALTENETTGTFSYSDGKVAGKAIRVDINLNISDSPLYADDSIAERAREFIDGTMTFTPNDLDPEVRAEWLGSEIDEETVSTQTVSVLKSTTEDTPGYFGFGCIIPKIKNNVKKYRAVFFPKVQFAEPNETAETKGQNISWQTPAIEGKIMRRIDGTWKEEATVDSFELAKDWLKSKLNIT